MSFIAAIIQCTYLAFVFAALHEMTQPCCIWQLMYMIVCKMDTYKNIYLFRRRPCYYWALRVTALLTRSVQMMFDPIHTCIGEEARKRFFLINWIVFSCWNQTLDIVLKLANKYGIIKFRIKYWTQSFLIFCCSLVL